MPSGKSASPYWSRFRDSSNPFSGKWNVVRSETEGWRHFAGISRRRKSSTFFSVGGDSGAFTGILAGNFGPLFPAEPRSEEHTSELQSHHDLVCRLLLE